MVIEKPSGWQVSVDKMNIGHKIMFSHTIGQKMYFWILSQSANLIKRLNDLDQYNLVFSYYSIIVEVHHILNTISWKKSVKKTIFRFLFVWIAKCTILMLPHNLCSGNFFSDGKHIPISLLWKEMIIQIKNEVDSLFFRTIKSA